MLSIEEVLGWVLDLNLGDGEGRGDIFGEDLDLASQRSLKCFLL